MLLEQVVRLLLVPIMLEELTGLMGLSQPLRQVVRLSLLLTVVAVGMEPMKGMLVAQVEEVVELEE